MRKSYIGITGFMDRREVHEIQDAIPPGSDRLLMVGVLVSSKTLRGEGNKHPMRYPLVERVREIFTNHPQVLNLVHFNTKEPDLLEEHLRRVAMLSGPFFHGFQLNMAWPAPRKLENYRKQFPKSKIVLQIGGHAMQLVDHYSKKLQKAVNPYKGLVDYVLLDPSGGFGKQFDPRVERPYLEALADLGIGLGVAGGLSPSTLHFLEPLLKDFPQLSIDAEGRLRNQDDELDSAIATSYLKKAYELLDGVTA